MKEEQDEGLPDSINVRRGACVVKAGAKGDRGRGASRRRALRFDGQSKSRGNKIDIQTAVQDNYTRYIGNRVLSPKRETNQYYRRERA
jgi:hypothetical protein